MKESCLQFVFVHDCFRPRFFSPRISRIFVQASAEPNCSGYAERSRIFVQASAIELAHIAERSRKSQSQFSCKRVQNRTIALSQMSKSEFTRILPWRAIALLRTCSGYAERSRKCQEKVHLYEQIRTFTAQKQQGESI